MNKHQKEKEIKQLIFKNFKYAYFFPAMNVLMYILINFNLFVAFIRHT